MITYGDLYCTGKNLFHRIFLQYKGSWAWRSICPVKISGYTVPILVNVATLASTMHASFIHAMPVMKS